MDRQEVARGLVKLAKELSKKQKEYQEFFEKKLEEEGEKSPADMSEKEKKEFFNEVEEEWTGDEEKKKKARVARALVRLARKILED